MNAFHGSRGAEIEIIGAAADGRHVLHQDFLHLCKDFRPLFRIKFANQLFIQRVVFFIMIISVIKACISNLSIPVLQEILRVSVGVVTSLLNIRSKPWDTRRSTTFSGMEMVLLIPIASS